MPNGTYGGVRGEPLKLPYSINKTETFQKSFGNIVLL